MNIIYKWIPYDIWHKAEYELWLKELAYSGLHVQKMRKYWGRFERVQPQTLEYRLCFSPKSLNESILTDYNWKKIKTSSDFALFQSASAKPSDELYKNKNLQIKDLIHKRESHERNAFWFLASIVFILLVLLWPKKYYTLNLVAQKYNIFRFYILVQFTCWYREMRSYKGLKALEESLIKGLQTKYIKSLKASIQKFFYFALLCFVFIVFFIEIKTIGNEKIPLPIEEIALPVIQLSTLEDASILERDPDDQQYTFYNYYEKYWKLFAYRVYKSDEDGILNTEEDINNKHPNVETEFYELTFKWMREPLVKDLIQRYQDEITVPYKDIVRQDAEGLDGVYILAENYNIELIGIKDNKVMYVKYSGNASLDNLIKEIARKIVF
nr:DUF2812 domain-containing protein [uncultured Niameybacter sp.]